MVVSHVLHDIFQDLPQTKTFNLPASKEVPLKVEFTEEDDSALVYNGPSPVLPFANTELFLAPITESRRLTANVEGCKDVYEVTFDVEGSNFTFRAGDTIGIVPQNTKSDVNFILKHLDLTSKADQSYILHANNGKIPPHVPVKSTIRHVLTHCVDLRCLLKKLFLLALSKHTKEEDERKIIEYLSSKEGSAAYQTHILHKQISILDVFRIFPSCKPPIEVLLANLPRLLPRPYSIVNTGLKNSKEIKICFSVMDLPNNKRGLTTGWMESYILNLEDIGHRLEKLSLSQSEFKVPIYVRKNLSSFHLPENFESPLILIGPGTGVAPFIGFLLEIEQEKLKNPSRNFGEVHLFFGCRDPKLDFIYEKELNAFVSRKTLTRLHTAFSRVENKAKYVQDALLNEGEKLAQLINQGAFVFVCGDVKTISMSVRETLIKCLAQYNICTDPESYLAEMEKDRRFVIDTWS